jgi:hypothetical protein
VGRSLHGSDTGYELGYKDCRDADCIIWKEGRFGTDMFPRNKLKIMPKISKLESSKSTGNARGWTKVLREEPMYDNNQTRFQTFSGNSYEPYHATFALQDNLVIESSDLAMHNVDGTCSTNIV